MDVDVDVRVGAVTSRSAKCCGATGRRQDDVVMMTVLERSRLMDGV
jgi:hypothetical protein